MGARSSKLKRSNKGVCKSPSEDDSIIPFDFPIPYDLLVDILSFVPTEDLIQHCRLVCKLWKDLIDGHSVWKLKCEREKKYYPLLKRDIIPQHFYRFIYVHNPYGKNLINNPCGESGLTEWLITRNGGDGFATENPPGGTNPIPAEVGTTCAFVTSFSACEKYQIIDLEAKGIHLEVLGYKNTKMEIGEWYSARFDCACVYRLDVILLDKNYDKVAGATNFSSCQLDQFEFEHTEEQWVGKAWHKVSHTFESVGEVRYVFFQHFGKDLQYWAGHYGSKMTGAYVRIII